MILLYRRGVKHAKSNIAIGNAYNGLSLLGGDAVSTGL